MASYSIPDAPNEAKEHRESRRGPRALERRKKNRGRALTPDEGERTGKARERLERTVVTGSHGFDDATGCRSRRSDDFEKR